MERFIKYLISLQDKYVVSMLHISEMQKEISSIWEALRDHIDSKVDEKVVKKALESVTIFLGCVEANEAISNGIVSNILAIIIDGILTVGSKNFELVSKLMVSSGSASPGVGKRLFNEIMPVILSQIEGNKIQHQHEMICMLDTIGKMVAVCKKQDVVIHLNAPLTSYIENLCIKAVMQEDRNVTKVRLALKILCDLSAILSTENRHLIYCKLLELMIHQRLEYESQMYDLVAALGIFYPEEVNAAIVQNVCFDNLDDISCKLLTNALIKLLVVPKLETMVYSLIMHNASNSSIRESVRVTVLATLREAVVSTSSNHLVFKNVKIIEELMQLCFHESSSSVLIEASNVMKSVISNLDVVEQQRLVDTYLEKIDLQAPQNIHVLNGLICCLDKQVNIDQHLDNILEQVIRIGFSFEDGSMRQASNHTLCYIFNKMPNNESSHLRQTSAFNILAEQISHNNTEAVITYAWILKGLVVRSFNCQIHLETVSYLVLLFSLFNK